jgi:hypothetical protein
MKTFNHSISIRSHTHIIACLLVLLFPFFAFGQVNKDNELLKVIGKYHNGSVLIRWAPAESWLFEYGQISGYKLEKGELTDSEFSKIKFEPIGNREGIIRPFSKQGIEAKVDTSDKYQMAAVGVLFDKSADSILSLSSKKVPSPGEIVKRNAIFKNRQLTGLMSADMSFNAACILGLGFKDSLVEKDKFYIYRLSVINTVNDIKKDTLYLTINTVYNNDEATILLKGEELERLIKIKWPKIDYLKRYSGFFIERSLDKVNFNPVNKLPFVKLSSADDKIVLETLKDSAAYFDYISYFSYLDSVKANYKPQYYRVLGIDAFGIKSIISDTIKLQGIDRTAPFQIYSVDKKVLNQKELQLQWQNPNTDLTELKGIQVEKGFRVDKDIVFEVISGEKWLSPTTSTWIDKNRIEAGTCYYRINVSDTAGNIGYGLPGVFAIEDTIAPLNPEWLKAELDTSGLLKIWYPKSKSSDVDYYKFFYNNEEITEYSVFEAKGTPDTVYYVRDFPVRTLNKHFFIKMLTVDFKGNMSLATLPIKVKIPDVIPPVTPTLQESELRDKILYAKYEKSGSNDVLQYLLQRSVDNREWQTFETRPANKVSGLFVEINDTIKEHGVYHRVRVIAVDESYLYSNASEYAEGRLTGKDRSKPCKNATAKYDAKLNRVEINWMHDEASFTEFLLYRKVNNGKSFFLGKTKNLGFYIDRDIKEKGNYNYIIIAITNNKGEAIPSEISVDIK